MSSSVKGRFQEFSALSSYRATFEMYIGRLVNKESMTDEEFLICMANMLRAWFSCESHIFNGNGRLLIKYLVDQGFLEDL